MSTIRLLPVNGTLATLAIDGPASATWNTIVQARPPTYEGDAGKLITIAADNAGTWVPNIGTLTFTGNAGDTETVTIGTKVYTFQTVLTNVDGNVLIGATASDSLDNLIAAINLGAGAGTTYATATTIHSQVRAYAGASDTMDVHTKTNTILDAVGTLIASTSTVTGGTWGAATLADGTDGTNVTFTVSGTAITIIFAPAYSTVSDFETALAADTAVSALIRVSTAGTTPLHRLATTTDEFSATALTGAGTTATNSPPTSATAGVKLPHCTDRAVVKIKSIAGSGSMTVTMKAWGYDSNLGWWLPLGIDATAANKGLLNGGSAIAEGPTADLITHAEEITGLRAFDRLYLEVTAIGGTATEIAAYLDCIPASSTTVG